MRTIIIVSFLILSFQNAFSADAEKLTNSYNFIGKGRLTQFIWDIYDVYLFSSDKSFSIANGLVLSFEYKRDVPKEKIIKSTLEEMEKQNVVDKTTLLQWNDFLQRCIQTSQKGSKPYIQWLPPGNVIFFYENVESCSINDRLFSTSFIDIWLGENTSRPKLRRALLGVGK